LLKVTIVGVDLAKNVLQLHGATADGTVVFRKKLTRRLFERFMAGHHLCTVAMEASAGAHHWARKFIRYGYQVRLIAPDWSLTSLKEKSIKIGAKVISHDRYVAFQMAEVAIRRHLFAGILRLVAELWPPPDPATD
jgi:hypothetical protein